MVATVLTVYGIETLPLPFSIPKQKNCCNSTYRLRYWNQFVATTLLNPTPVATVLTVYGIETFQTEDYLLIWNDVATVLTVYGIETRRYFRKYRHLQWYRVATVLTVYGIETYLASSGSSKAFSSCNSTYRLRYWNTTSQCTPNTSSSWKVATVLTVYGIETR